MAGDGGEGQKSVLKCHVLFECYLNSSSLSSTRGFDRSHKCLPSRSRRSSLLSLRQFKKSSIFMEWVFTVDDNVIMLRRIIIFLSNLFVFISLVVNQILLKKTLELRKVMDFLWCRVEKLWITSTSSGCKTCPFANL